MYENYKYAYNLLKYKVCVAKIQKISLPVKLSRIFLNISFEAILLLTYDIRVRNKAKAELRDGHNHRRGGSG